MAEITYDDIRNAISEALSIHDSEVARNGSAELKLREETKHTLDELLKSIKAEFKREDAEDQKLRDDLKDHFLKLGKKVEESGKGGSSNTGSILSGGDSSDKIVSSIDNKTEVLFKKIGGKIDGFFGGAAKLLDGFMNNKIMKGITAFHAIQNEATQEVINSMKSLNSNGIAQDWDQFREGLRGSKISLDDLNKSIQQHGTSFATLNKMTGNAVGTYQKLATQAANYAANDAKIAYDSSQTTEALNSYLEMQRSAGNLDRLNEAEMQDGVNRLMKSADSLSKEFGISRDALLKSAAEKNKDVDMVLETSGLSAKQIEDAKLTIASMKESGQGAMAKLVEDAIATGGKSKDLFALNAQLQSKEVGEAIRLFQEGRHDEAAKIMNSETVQNQLKEAQQKMGKELGTYNMYGNSSQKLLTQAMHEASVSSKSRDKEAGEKTDETLVKEQQMRNEQTESANDKLYAFSMTAKTAGKYFDTMTTTLKGVNAALRQFGDLLTRMGKSGFWSSILGTGGAFLNILGTVANAWTTFRSFFGKNTVNIATKVAKGIGRLFNSAKLSRLASFRTKAGKTSGLSGLKTKAIEGLSKIKVNPKVGKALGKVGSVVSKVAKNPVVSKTLGFAGKALGPVIAVAQAGMDVFKGIKDYKKSGETKDLTKGVGKAGGGLAGAWAGGALGVQIGTIFGPVGTAIGGALGAGIGYLAGSKVGGWIGEKMGPVVDGIGKVGKALGKGIGWVGEKAWDGIKSAGKGISNLWNKYGDNIKDSVKNIGSKAASFVKTALTNPVEGIKKLSEIGKSLRSKIFEGAKGLLSKIGGWFGFGKDKDKKESETDEKSSETLMKEPSRKSFFSRLSSVSLLSSEPSEAVGTTNTLSKGLENTNTLAKKPTIELDPNDPNYEAKKLAMAARADMESQVAQINEVIAPKENKENSSNDRIDYSSKIADRADTTNDLLTKMLYAIEKQNRSNV